MILTYFKTERVKYSKKRFGLSVILEINMD